MWFYCVEQEHGAGADTPVTVHIVQGEAWRSSKPRRNLEEISLIYDYALEKERDDNVLAMRRLPGSAGSTIAVGAVRRG